MLCAIHQPNFFPWLGYFDKIARSDVFVFLDHVDYEKSGHSMQSITNRVGIIGGERVHCSVIREHGPQLIDAVIINYEQPWKLEMLKKLEKQYSKAPYWNETYDLIRELIDFPTTSLSQLNINAIRRISNLMGLTTRFVKQSDLNVQGHSNELLINIIKSVGCTGYMHGKGGNKYQDTELFREAGIELFPQNFEAWEYPQGDNEEFVKGLSVIDAFCWIGIKETGIRVSERGKR